MAIASAMNESVAATSRPRLVYEFGSCVVAQVALLLVAATVDQGQKYVPYVERIVTGRERPWQERVAPLPRLIPRCQLVALM
jgi:hypothetical protein